MRKINSILAVIALCVVAIASCKKDEPAAAPAYIGSWKESHFVASGCTDPANNEDHICPTAECETITFTATTITIIKPGSANENYTFTASGTTLTVTVAPSQTISVTVVVSGTTLTLTYQNSPADGNCTNVTTYTKI